MFEGETFWKCKELLAYDELEGSFGSLLAKSSMVSVFLVYAIRPFDGLEPCNHYSLFSF